MTRPAKNVYPLAVDVADKDEIYVGRIREDESIENGINMWIVADNLRKGAALNAVQIAEHLIGDGIVFCLSCINYVLSSLFFAQ